MKTMQWLKLEFMKTPGYMRVNISLLTILMISSVSSTALQIIKMGESTSDVNISGNLEEPNGSGFYTGSGNGPSCRAAQTLYINGDPIYFMATRLIQGHTSSKILPLQGLVAGCQ